MVIPEINGEDARHHQGIIANPNCSTIIALMSIYAVDKLSKITDIIASTYQAVSGAGNNGIYELEEQILALLKEKKLLQKYFLTKSPTIVFPKLVILWKMALQQKK